MKGECEYECEIEWEFECAVRVRRGGLSASANARFQNPASRILAGTGTGISGFLDATVKFVQGMPRHGRGA
jgi:hypothetical protein